MTEPVAPGLSLLAGVRIVDFSQALSGPYCTLMLADLGAEVIKIESPHRGDDSRHWGPPYVGEDAAYFMSVNRNKRSVALDLKDPDDLAAVLDIVKSADVVAENWRPGTAARLGLGADRLRLAYPGLIVCSISGFGQDQGPRAGYDQILQGTSGVMSLTGPVGEPTKWGVPVGDLSAGMFAATAIVAALYQRRATGLGRTIDISMQDSLVSMLTHHAARFLNTGVSVESDHNGHATIAPYGLFQTSDGFINICVGNDSQFQRMCESLGHPRLAQDTRYATNPLRLAHKRELLADLGRVLSTGSVDSTITALERAGVPVGRVRDIGGVLDDPATLARQMVLTFEREDSGPARVVNTPWKFDGVAPVVRTPPPHLGQHTVEVIAGNRTGRGHDASRSTSSGLSAVLARALVEARADTVFGLPGGGNNLDFIGAVESAGLRFVLAHGETSAAIMAAVYADLTGAPAGCVVTRGPGAASAVNGVASALLDRQSVLLVTDAVSSADRERIAHQRIDQRAIFAPVTKWSATAGAGDSAQTVAFALATTMTHPRGPVHLDFDPTGSSTPPPAAAPDVPVDANAMDLARQLVADARKPLLILGVGARHVVEPVRTLVRNSAAPVLTTYRAKGAIPDSWPNAAGLLTGATTEAPLLAAADLIVMVGMDSVELIPGDWPYAAPVVSVAAWPETSPYLTPAVELVGDLDRLVADLAEAWPVTHWEQTAGNRHRDSELTRLVSAGREVRDGLAPQTVVQRIRAAAPAGSIGTVDAGAHMFPAMSLWPVENIDEVSISSGLATMGYAVPAAIGAALARPGRRIICFVGDGGLGMALGELETVSRLDLPITIVVFNDSRLSLIAIKAKAEDNGGENAISYRDVDFAAVADGFGLHGERAATVEELDAALALALSRTGPTLIDVRVDPSGYAEIVASIRGQRGR